MANSNLPTTLTPNSSTGHTNNHQVLHTEVNELSRATGVRDVTSFLLNGWTADYIRIERIRDRVYLYFKGLNGTNATSSRWLDFQNSGIGGSFSPTEYFESALFRASDNYQFRIGGSLTAGLSSAQGAGSVLGSTAVREISWRCIASWPSTLPGTAV